jgi:hypothetical protein
MLSRTFILTLLVTVLLVTAMTASGPRGARAQSLESTNCESLDDPDRSRQCKEVKKELEDNPPPPVRRPSNGGAAADRRGLGPSDQNGTPGPAADDGPGPRPPGPAADDGPRPRPPGPAADDGPGPRPPGPAADDGPRPRPPGPAADDGPRPRPPGPATPVAGVPGPELKAAVDRACGVLLPADSGAPDPRAMIIVAASKRSAIDSVLGTPPAADVEAVNVNGCFAQMGKSEYVVVTPPGKPNAFEVSGGDGRSDLSKWLAKSAAEGPRLKLAPGSECADILAKIGGRARAAWVEDRQGPSLCEWDPYGGARVDPNKFDGYGGAIVLKIDRG